MCINNPSLQIHSHSWGTMWVDRVPQPQLATCMWTINSPSIVKMASNLARGCTVTCQMMVAPWPSNLVWNIQKKIIQKHKFRVPFVKHQLKSLLGSCKTHDGVMVDHIVTTKHHLDQPKSFIHYSKTLVKIPKFITNIIKNFSKSIDTPSLMAYICVSIIVHEK